MPRLLKIVKKRSSTVLRLSRELGTDPVRFVMRYAWLAKAKGFSEEEIFALALMDPALAFRELKHYESKRNTRPVYRELNSSNTRELIDDKDLFHRECDRHKLASAPVMARLTREDLAELQFRLSRVRRTDTRGCLPLSRAVSWSSRRWATTVTASCS